MISKSERPEINKNNNINEFYNDNLDDNFENTNKALLNCNRDLLLNKKIIKNSQNSNNVINKNNTVQLKNNILLKDDFINIDKNEWFKNKLKIIKDMKEKKIIYNLELESDNAIKEGNNILSAYKDKGFYTIYRYINLNKENGKEIKAKIKWNIFSNHFKIFDNLNNILEEINYNFNFKGWNGPTKLNILIPSSNKNIGNGMWTDRNNKLIMHKMENKLPEYNSIYKCYVLNFVNRKVIPNEKNLQIIYSDLKEEKDNILLQFAQAGNDEYILDYKYPFSNITALALALTTLSSRMFCQ